MKKETAILAILIAFLVGFITGAVVALLRGTKGLERVAIPPSPKRVQPSEGEPDLASIHLRIKALQETLQKDPKNLQALEELGNLYFDTGKPREAIEAYSQYLAIQPEDPNVRTDMGIMFRALGDSDRAIAEFKRAAQSDPKHLNSRFNIGVVLLHDKNDVQGAIAAWEDYLKVDPNSDRAIRLKAQIERMKGMGKDVPKVSK